MTARPRKSTARPAARPAATTAPTAPAAFSLTNLQVTDSAALDTSTGRAIDLASTPFPAALQASWDARKSGGRRGREYGSPKEVTVPSAKVNSVVRLIRDSAGSIGLGVRIVKSDPDENGNVKVAFRAQTKRNDDK